MQKMVFGGGCFWCTEAVFKMLRGVGKVLPGYSGGTIPNPTYEQVSNGTTGHAEVIYLEFDPKKINYRDLLTVFFATHDPTTKNRQGNDIGTQYRSVIFFTTPEQEAEASKYIKEIPGAVTELELLKEFYWAENYHHDYYEAHKDAPYCQIIVKPKIKKVQKEFASLLKNMSESELEKEVMWNKGTEVPFSGKYVYTKDNGMYVCKNCGTELFKSDAKFDSGTGWPSFDQPSNLQNIELTEDNSHDMYRTEVICKKCRAHLGHVFNDGPTKTGKRYCVNSVCLDLVDTKNDRV